MNGWIYAFRNKLNGKYYVGQTINIKKRKSKHLAACSGSRRFNQAMRKYGREAFEFMVLKVTSHEKLNESEQFYIKLLRAYPDGYNLTPGGDAHSEEQNEITSKSTKARWASMTEEQRRAISDKCSAKAKAQWSAIPKEKRADMLVNARAALKTIEKPERMTCTKAKKIFDRINSQIKKAHRKEMERLEEKRIQSNPYSLEMRRRRKVGKRKVLCVETGNTYESAHEASRVTGICRINIVQVCNPNHYKVTAGGYHWRYAS